MFDKGKAMERYLTLSVVVVALVLGCIPVAESQTNRLFVYYPTWAVYTMPPKELKFPKGMETIYIHFSAHVSGTSPFFGPAMVGHGDSTDLSNTQRALIDTCHRNGQKVLLSITAQGGDGTTLQKVALNTTDRKKFVSSVSSYLKRKGYDGLDLDWESGLDSHAVTLLIKEFRDTLNAWARPGFLMMATQPDPFIYPGLWSFYNTATMNSYLDAYVNMNYVLNSSEKRWGSLGAANSVWRCMFDCPYTYPTQPPWSGYAGGYWAADFTHNGISKWIANGAAREKVGIGLWNGGTTMLNSSTSMTPGSPISYGTQGYVSYSVVLGGTKNYVPEADCYWGIVNGLYCSWIDSAGAFKRTKWAKDTMHTNNFMLYDAHSGFIPTGRRYGRQPHFDAMVNAIRF